MGTRRLSGRMSSSEALVSEALVQEALGTEALVTRRGVLPRPPPGGTRTIDQDDLSPAFLPQSGMALRICVRLNSLTEPKTPFRPPSIGRIK